EFQEQYRVQFAIAEWIFTGLFTVEYLLRLIAVRKPLQYATSFFGVVDLLAILPTFIGLLVPGSASLRVVRILRLLRMFRVLKLVGFLEEARVLQAALRATKKRILVFLSVVLALVTIIGTLMYLIEDGQSGFTSIPTSIYWAIVTVTTVGYGDITPTTVLGQMLASVMMIIGYAIIAVPTGILGMAMVKRSGTPPLESNDVSTQACPSCGRDGHDSNAEFCKYCGQSL
ncbi:MAG: ion transporter, partial [Flavobacteriales bacterium]|nr:ion transporter [Flavobacteriales bacterium]